MNSIKNKLLYNWHLMRLIRLAFGLWLVVLCIKDREWITGLLGAFFLYQAVTDTGCCGSGACYNDKNYKSMESPTNIIETKYEEIK